MSATNKYSNVSGLTWYQANKICDDEFGTTLPTIFNLDDNGELVDMMNYYCFDVIWIGWNGNVTIQTNNKTGFIGAMINDKSTNFTFGLGHMLMVQRQVIVNQVHTNQDMVRLCGLVLAIRFDIGIPKTVTIQMIMVLFVIHNFEHIIPNHQH